MLVIRQYPCGLRAERACRVLLVRSGSGVDCRPKAAYMERLGTWFLTELVSRGTLAKPNPKPKPKPIACRDLHTQSAEYVTSPLATRCARAPQQRFIQLLVCGKRHAALRSLAHLRPCLSHTPAHRRTNDLFPSSLSPTAHATLPPAPATHPNTSDFSH